MKKPIRMVALDLDGTLALDNHRVSGKTRTALVELAGVGVEVVIATGRRYRTTRYVIENLGLDVFAVCNGGALGKRPDATTFHETPFAAEDLRSLVDFARSHGLSLFGQRDSHRRGGADFVVDDGADWHAHVQRYFDDNRAWCARGDLASHEQEILIMGAFHEQSPLVAFVEALEEAFPGKFNTVIVPVVESDHFYLEIAQTHVDKWHGLQALAALKNIDAAAICAVGDQLNDLPMVRRAGHGFAMGNGNPELKRHARYVCGAHDQDGLLDVVRYIRTHNEGA